VVTKYYFAGASRIAMKKNNVVTYLVGDHLGSSSLAVNSSTGEIVETRYKPWGEVRWTSDNKTLPTRFTFTGQYSYVDDSATDLSNAGFGLMFYNARWYDPQTGRMAQADTVVPGGVQGLDRYAYAGNSPLVYTDPTGHYQEGVCRGGSDYRCRLHAWEMELANGADYWSKKIQTDFPNVKILTPDKFTSEQLLIIYNSLTLVREKFGSQEAFAQAFGSINFSWVLRNQLPIDPKTGEYAVAQYDPYSNTIKLSSDAFSSDLRGTWNVIHELGHQFDFRGSFGNVCNSINICDPKKLKSNTFVTVFMPDGCPTKLTVNGCGEGSWAPIDLGITDYGLTNSEEDFAESFTVAVLFNQPAFGASRMRLSLINAWIYLSIQNYSD